MLTRDGLDQHNQRLVLAEIIKRTFASHNNLSLSFYLNETLLNSLANSIVEHLRVDQYEYDLKIIKKIIKNGDFLLVAEYLNAIKNDDKDMLRLFVNFDNNMDIIRQINRNRFLRLNASQTKNNPVYTSTSLDDLFSNDQNSSVFYYDNNFQSIFADIYQIAGDNIGAYIDSHYDLPGINSLVRKGLVKSIVASDNSIIVTKRDNPEKKGRFLTEQNNINLLRGLLRLPTQNDFVQLDQAVFLKMISPLAVYRDKVNNKYYSLSAFQKGRTLEHVLLTETNLTKRARHLTASRLILDHLYENGIIWGDMAPRNIIVDENEDGVINYYILDFEKTKLLGRPATMNERIEHCRGPMCVEEFGAICTLDEVTKCFDGYFSPSEWDVLSADVIPFEKPKRELLAIFEGRGIRKFNFGDYNKLEAEVIKIRFPFVDKATKKMRRPLNICFKVDHYLGADFDRKTTEVLMSARSHRLLSDTMDLLESCLELLDSRLITSDFVATINSAPSSLNVKDCFELNFLSNTLSHLYESRHDKTSFAASLSKSKIMASMLHIRAENIDASAATNKELFLAQSIVPSDTFLISGIGAELRTNRGPMIDLSSMTVNCILGQNDPWVKANQMAYLKSERPSFHRKN